jgi:hypothetical protein
VELRKLVTYVEEIHKDGDRAANPPQRMAAAAAVIRNPWAGQGYVADLKPVILDVAPKLGRLLVDKLIPLLSSAAAIEAYGKAANVGSNGEIEYASALIHTLRFGNIFRDAVAGTSPLSFSNKRSGPGGSITIPMTHKTDEPRRSHFLTLEFAIPDAPGPDEIVVAIGGAVGGRPHARIGDRRQDAKEMGLA